MVSKLISNDMNAPTRKSVILIRKIGIEKKGRMNKE